MPKLRASGGYRHLRSFQVATLIYDGTVWFCERFMSSQSRTIDQMVQAARSGRQNIAEGSRASATSTHTELRLVNVARSSLDELLLDYEDFLRHRHFPQWGPDDPEARKVRELAKLAGKGDPSDPSDRSDHDLYSPWLEHDDPAVRANTLICLIHQANYLLDQQICALEQAFVKGGGYSEQLAALRLAHRSRSNQNPPGQTEPIPRCPKCGAPMVLRTARKGGQEGNPFWGCTAYPDCRGIVPV